MLPILIALLVLVGGLTAKAATHTAANLTIGAVSNAMVLCAPYDTLKLPAGTASWTNGLYNTNCIFIIGDGMGATIISNAIPNSTTLAYQHLFTMDLRYHSSTTFIGGMTLTEDPSQTANTSSFGIMAEGDNKDGRRIAVTNIHFYSINGFNYVNESAVGVVSRCQFDSTGVAIYGYHRTWNGGTMGHGSWATNLNFGTDQALYIEDCGFNFLEPGFTYTCLDGYGGFRFVFRYNRVTNGTPEGHGPEVAVRGTKQSENYMNYYTNTTGAGRATYHRSGSHLVWSNLVADSSSSGPFKLIYFRTFELPTQWGWANGTNLYDLNSGTLGVPFATGVVTATNVLDSRVLGVTVTGSPYTINEWTAYSIVRTNDTGGLGSYASSIILSNSANTIYYPVPQNGLLRFTVGDSFRIFKCSRPIDGIGVGKGDLLTDTTVAPANQIIEPCYEWHNYDHLGNNIGFEPAYTTMLATNGVHYFADTPMPGYSAYTYPNPILRFGGDTPATVGTNAPASLSGGAKLSGGASIK